ncbi:hypothetical protein LCGC14_2482160 [marine sediment metagenome]|uniref:Uncharacterized protein n=1 Tax=marine sediment metagenome TaxID=412755 RepID=A0A0F9B835_9ZZZZ
MNKLKEYGWEATIAVLVGAGIALLYLWISGTGVIAGLEDKREETKELVDQLHEQNEELVSERVATREQNAALLGLIRDMRTEQRRLRDEVRDLREITIERVRAVRNLSMPQVVVDTSRELELPVNAILLLPDNTIGFTPDAAHTNLEHLILGTAAKTELGLSNKRIENLLEQLAKGATIVANKDTIIAGQETELANVRTELTAELDLRDMEIKGLKHKLRRSKIKAFFGSLSGIVIGYLLGGL